MVEPGKPASKSGQTGLVVLALVVSLGVAWLVVSYRGVGVLPWPRSGGNSASASSAYGAEACESRVATATPENPHQGWFTVLTRDASRAFHSTYLWDQRYGSLMHVVSVQESDPGSGRSDAVHWSRDGRALLITGSGRLPLQRSTGPLALAYVIDSGTLHELPACR